jgi:hypothetical protein
VKKYCRSQEEDTRPVLLGGHIQKRKSMVKTGSGAGDCLLGPN